MTLERERCPNCGGTLVFDGSPTWVTCTYCQERVHVTSEVAAPVSRVPIGIDPVAGSPPIKRAGTPIAVAAVIVGVALVLAYTVARREVSTPRNPMRCVMRTEPPGAAIAVIGGRDSIQEAIDPGYKTPLRRPVGTTPLEDDWTSVGIMNGSDHFELALDGYAPVTVTGCDGDVHTLVRLPR